MGGKGSGRPKGSDKPLSEVFSGLYGDVVDLEMKLIKKKIGAMYKDFNALKSKISYHIRKHEKEERKLTRLKKRN
jgi:hypothetical protein